MKDVESWGKATAIPFLTLSTVCGSVVTLYHTVPVPRVSTSAQYGATIGTLKLCSGNCSGVKLVKDRLKVMSPLLFT